MGKISKEYMAPKSETIDLEKNIAIRQEHKNKEANKYENVLKHERADKKQRQLRNLNKTQIK